MFKHMRNTWFLAAIAIVPLAGCSDATDPVPGRFNHARVEAGVTAVERAAASSVLGSLAVVGHFAGDVGAASAASNTARWDSGLENAVRRIAGVSTDVGAALVPVMRASALGKTFVYDGARRKYVESTRAGAPTTGVRFVLYETRANGDPDPGNETGYADLTDERRATASTAGIRLVVVTDGVTRLSYSFDLAGSLDAATFDVRGFISDGNDRLEFTIKTSQQLFGRGGNASLDATLRVPNQDFVVTAKVQGTAGESSGDGAIDLVIASGTDQIIVDAETVEGLLDATFTVNDRLLATATGDPKAPVIRGEDGRELTAEELHALGSIVEMADGLFKFVSGLLLPAGVLLLVALGIGG